MNLPSFELSTANTKLGDYRPDSKHYVANWVIGKKDRFSLDLSGVFRVATNSDQEVIAVFQVGVSHREIMCKNG